MEPAPTPPLASGWKRLFLCLLGLVCVGLGYLGAVLPGLPVTPFLIAASYCFVRSSPRLHRWLRRSPWVGRVLHDWEEHRGVRRSVKVVACCLIVTAVTLSVTLGGMAAWLKWLIGGLAVVGITVVLSLPTVRRLPPLSEAAPDDGSVS